MKVRKLLEIQSKFEEAVIPSDMNNDELEKHYSESKDKEINILDMDLIHLVRSYSKCIRLGKIRGSDKEDLKERLDTILVVTHGIRKVLDKNEK
tara:strand:- start:742 stop:1023 length:282 start_codon:yes stop_codon:yes gene_type:complete